MYIYARTYFLSASCVSEFLSATSYDSELQVNHSTLTNYFKMNYCKFCCKTFIVTTAIMSDNRESPGYAVFYQGRISSFSQSELRTHPCHVRIGNVRRVCGARRIIVERLRINPQNVKFIHVE